MTSVGVLEAKTRLSTLLDQVESGEEVTITRHGRAVAKLVPAHPVIDSERSLAAVQRMFERRKNISLGGLSWKDLRDEGRR